jgi:hypothetical protein
MAFWFEKVLWTLVRFLAFSSIRIHNTRYLYLPDNSKEYICMLQGTYYFLFVFYLSWPAWRPAVKWLLGGGPPAPPPQDKKAE